MSLDQDKAIELLRDLIEADKSVRPWNESYWTMAQMYNAGKQWGYLSRGDGYVDVRHLRSIIDPNRDDVRVTLNQVTERVGWFKGSLRPQRIAGEIRPRSDIPTGRTYANAAQTVLSKYLEGIRALQTLRERDNPRCVFGTSYVRRHLYNAGAPLPVGQGDDGLLIRNFNLNWCVVPPWQVLRRPDASSTRPNEDEEIFAQWSPVSVDWIKQNFGVDIETESSLCDLMGYQNQIRNAAHGPGTQNSAKSKTKGVLFYECYFKDAELGDGWHWVLFGYIDPSNKYADNIVTPLPDGKGFAKNPFHGLPFHQFSFESYPSCPFGIGIPHMLMAGQDLTNLAWTWIARVMQQGAGKVMFESGTLDNHRKALNNRVDVPLIWKRNPTMPAQSQPPQRLQPPQMSPAAMQIAQVAPAWMDGALNLSGVQRGEAVKRGESARAYEIRLSGANVFLNDIRRTDELIYEELLLGTAVDIIRMSRLDQLQNICRGSVSDDHLYLLKRHDPEDVLEKYVPHESMVRPVTPGEVRESFISLATNQFMVPEDAQWEMGLRGVWVNSRMESGRSKQLAEIDLLISGQESRVSMGDAHQYHIRTIEDYINEPRWMSLPEEIRQRIHQHLIAHYVAQSRLAMSQGGQQPPEPQAQGSPPSSAVEAALGRPGGGPAGPPIPAIA